MKITLKLFATLTDYLPPTAKYTHQIELEMAAGTTIARLVEQHHLPEKLVHLVLVNGTYIAPDQRVSHTLTDGDVLAIWPPIAGG